MINPPIEAIEQQKLVSYLRLKRILHFAPTNENQSSFTNRKVTLKVEAKAKSMGKSKGVPDICIPVPSNHYNGLFIELKRARKKLKNGRLSISHTKTSLEQKEWIRQLNSNGYKAIVCYGAVEAIKVVDDYIREATDENK